MLSGRASVPTAAVSWALRRPRRARARWRRAAAASSPATAASCMRRRRSRRARRASSRAPPARATCRHRRTGRIERTSAPSSPRPPCRARRRSGSERGRVVAGVLNRTGLAARWAASVPAELRMRQAQAGTNIARVCRSRPCVNHFLGPPGPEPRSARVVGARPSRQASPDRRRPARTGSVRISRREPGPGGGGHRARAVRAPYRQAAKRACTASTEER